VTAAVKKEEGKSTPVWKKKAVSDVRRQKSGKQYTDAGTKKGFQQKRPTAGQRAAQQFSEGLPNKKHSENCDQGGKSQVRKNAKPASP